MNDYPSTYPSIYPSIYLSIYPSIYGIWILGKKRQIDEKKIYIAKQYENKDR